MMARIHWNHSALKVLTGLLVASCIIFFISRKVQQSIVPTELSDQLFSSNSLSKLACVVPQLKPDTIEPKARVFLCEQQLDLARLVRGRLIINYQAEKLYGRITCDVKPLLWKDDASFSNGDIMKNVQNNSEVPVDFNLVTCKSSKGYSMELPMKTIVKQSLPPQPIDMSKSKRFNIAIIMIDSLSKTSWYKYMPSFTEYFENTLNGIVLNGHNIVGDGTPQNMFPVLNGQSEFEGPEIRRGHDNAQFIDEAFPWLWRNASKLGYVTALYEDQPMFSAFSYRFKGFSAPPVNHFGRIFELALAKKGGFAKALGWLTEMCVGNRTRHVDMFNYVSEFLLTYDTIAPSFAMLATADVTHDNNGMASYLTNDLRNLFHNLRNHKHLFENTVFVVLSDHGPRFISTRMSLEGRLQERLPFVGLVIPPEFRKLYPTAVSNLIHNGGEAMLSTPYDLHDTLLDVLHNERLLSVTSNVDYDHLNSRSQSLFERVPENRTCAHAGVEPHWCSCVGRQPIVDTDGDEAVQLSAESVVDAINRLIAEARQQEACATLKLSKVVSATEVSVNRDVLRFKGTMDADGYKPNLSDNMQLETRLIEVNLLVSPSNGNYLATCRYSTSEKKAVCDPKVFSRVDHYGQQPHCIIDKSPLLRPYCYCKVQNKDENKPHFL